MSVWRPSCVVNLRVRFDEALHFLPRPLPDPVSGYDLAAGAPNASQRPPAPVPFSLSGGRDNLSAVFGIVPRAAVVELPGVWQAGTFDLTLDFRDLPLPPQVLRSCDVEVHLGAISDKDFSEGIAGVERPGGQRTSVLRTRDEGGGIRRDTLLLLGRADEESVKHGPERSEVRLKGRDLRGALLSLPVSPNLMARAPLREDLPTVVSYVLSTHPRSAGINVVWNPDDWPVQPNGKRGPPSVAGVGASDFNRARMGADGSQPQSTLAGDPHKLNAWSLIVKYCQLLGAVPYFDGPDLVIRPVRAVYDVEKLSGFDPRFPTPFAGGKVRTVQTDEGPRRLNYRHMIYGRNVESVEIARKFNDVAVRPTVRCVSVDTTSKKRGVGRVLIADWPDRKAVGKNGLSITKARQQVVSASGDVAEEQIMLVPVPGIRNLERLRRIAQDLYEAVGRGELSGRAETSDMASFGGDAGDVDLVRLRPGDPVRFSVDARALSSRAPAIAELISETRRSFEEQVSAVKARLGDENLARVLVASARGQVEEAQSLFRTSSVRYAWGLDKLQIGFDFQNYVETRSDVTPDAPDNKAAPRGLSTPQRSPPAAAAPSTPAAPRPRFGSF